MLDLKLAWRKRLRIIHDCWCVGNLVCAYGWTAMSMCLDESGLSVIGGIFLCGHCVHRLAGYTVSDATRLHRGRKTGESMRVVLEANWSCALIFTVTILFSTSL